MQWTIFDHLMTPHGSSGKTSPESSAQPTTPLAPSWADWQAVMPPWSTQAHGQARVWLLDPAASSHGASWMPNTTEWPSAADVSLCSLADVLHRAEDGPLPTRYYLSPTAAAGILRRAAKRGKALPTTLQAALESVAQSTR